MKSLLLILSSIFWVTLQSQSQSSGYVLKMSDGSIQLADNSISINQINSSKLLTFHNLANGNGFLKNNGSGVFTYENPTGSGTVTDVSIVTANGISGSVATSTSTPAITLTLGAITPTTVNGNTFTTGTYTLTGAAGKTLTFNNTLTFAGTDGTTMTFPSTSATLARTDAANTFTGVQTFSSAPVLSTGTVIVGGNAITFPSSAATLLPSSTTSGVAATATASGTTTVTHSLGRIPTTIRIYSISNFTNSASATPVPFSIGTWTTTSGNRCVYMVINGTSAQVSQTSTAFAIILVTSAGNRIEGVIQNVTSTGFDIAWTETGTHTNGNYMWEAQ